MDPKTEAAPATETEEVEATAPEDTATSGETTEKPETDEAHKPRRNRRSFDQRISQLTAQLRQAERELQEARKPVAPSADDKPPKREDFADYEEYIEAKAEYRAAKAAEAKLSEAEKRRRQEADKYAAEQHQQMFIEARETTIGRGAEAYPDFEDVALNDDVTITEVMADALLSHPKGHDLWYHLGKNLDVAEQIAGLPPVQQLLRLGELSATLSGKKASAAPKPTPTVTPRGASNKALRDDLPLDEWMRRRNAQVRRSG